MNIRDLEIGYIANESTSKGAVVFVNGSVESRLEPGKISRVHVPTADASVHVLSTTFSVGTIVLLVLVAMTIYGIPVSLGFAHMVRKSTKPDGQLNSVSRMLALDITELSDHHSNSARPVEIHQSSRRLKALSIGGGPQTISPSLASRGPSYVRIIDREKRVVKSFPVVLAEGTSYEHSEEVAVKKGFEITKHTGDANLEMDIFLVTATVKKHYGEDRVSREEELRSVTQTISLVGRTGGTSYQVEWVETWARGEVTDGVEVHGTFWFREDIGPRTSELVVPPPASARR